MLWHRYLKTAVSLLFLVLLSSCTPIQSNEGSFDTRLAEFRKKAATHNKLINANANKKRSFIQVKLRKTRSGEGGFAFKLVNVSIADASKTLLGELIKAKYEVDPDVKQNVSIHTTQAISREAILSAYRTILQSYGVDIIRQNDFLKIQLWDEISDHDRFPSKRFPELASNKDNVNVIAPLTYISAPKIVQVLKELGSGSNTTVHANKTHNMLILSGSKPNVVTLRHAISVFDVSHMRDKSFRMVKIKTSSPADMIKRLNAKLSQSSFNTTSEAIQFIPNSELNSVLLVSSNPKYIFAAEKWISELDTGDPKSADQLYVYRIQNRPADELANILKQIFLSDKSSETASKEENDTENKERKKLFQLAGNKSESEQASASANLRIVADKVNNSLHIRSTATEYRNILRVLKRADVMPHQVLLEATIAEVTLNDELKYGLKWYLEKGNNKSAFGDAVSSAISSAFPGFSYFFSTSKMQISLEALASVTDVNIISTPSVIVLNNKKATLQVGDQVPVTTTTTDSDNDKVTMTSFRNTGVILSVMPRVNDQGRIMLEIEQEVSEVNESGSSLAGAAVKQRKIKTEVIVNNGASLTLGGLIQDGKRKQKNKVPVAGDIPVVGNLLKNKDNSVNRTELLIIITPRIVKDPYVAMRATDELQKSLKRRH